MDKRWPLILIEDSDLSSAITDIREGSKNIVDGNIKKIAEYSKLIEIDDDSENLASAVHLCLTISF